MRLDPTLLEPLNDVSQPMAELEATSNGVNGTYSTERFVLRLSAEVHRLVDIAVADAAAGRTPSDEALQGYSTYLHETVHWWQHIGSTAGFILSLQHPAIAHVATRPLKDLVGTIGPIKPIKEWAETRRGRGLAAETMAQANRAVNNTLDMRFFSRLMTSPDQAEHIVSHPYFNTVGHTYWMGFGHSLSVLSATIDREFSFLPDARRWDAGFERLRADGAPGFGEPETLSPVGLRHLMEGQARFAQLQFLSMASSEPPSMEDLRSAGQLDGVYGAAYDLFLSQTGATAPERMDDPAIGLFMLILDLAINPTRGFPEQIEFFEEFFRDVDPGVRFLRLCAAARNHPETHTVIRDYSRDEYLAVTGILTAACGFDHPITALRTISGWTSEAQVRDLLEEKRLHRFKPDNLVIRVLFAYFVSFSADKLRNPEFFCWPGAWKVSPRANARSVELWMKYLSLFTDKADDDGVYPRTIVGIAEADLVRLLTDFIVNLMVYDLTHQWVLQPGHFVYPFSWVSQRLHPAELEDGARRAFKMLFGVDPEDFQTVR